MALPEILSGSTTIGASKPSFLKKNIVSIIVGFGGWFLFHTIFWLSIFRLFSGSGPGAIEVMICMPIPIVVSIITVGILLLRKNGWVALGGLAAFLINTIVVLLIIDRLFLALLSTGMMLPFYMANFFWDNFG